MSTTATAKRKLLGSVGVDSGRLMVADPCYQILVDMDDESALLMEVSGCGPTNGSVSLGLHFLCPNGDGVYPVYFEADPDGNQRVVIELGRAPRCAC